MMMMVSCFCFLMMMVMLVWFLLVRKSLAFRQSSKVLTLLAPWFLLPCLVLSVLR